jgi:hypothetical protein
MLHAQGVVDLLLKLRVRTDLLRAASKCAHFHLQRYRRSLDVGERAAVGILNTTGEVNGNPSVEVDHPRSDRGILQRFWVNAQRRNAACSLTAITREPLIFVPKKYRHVQLVLRRVGRIFRCR